MKTRIALKMKHCVRTRTRQITGAVWRSYTPSREKQLVWIVVVVLIFVLCLLFIHGASMGRSERYQQELDDEQMRCVSKNRKSKNRKTGKDAERKAIGLLNDEKN